MQIMFYARRGKYVAATIQQLYPQAQIILCESYEEALKRIMEPGGDPCKLAVIPRTQERDASILILSEMNGLQIVSQARIALQIPQPSKGAPEPVTPYRV